MAELMLKSHSEKVTTENATEVLQNNFYDRAASHIYIKVTLRPTVTFMFTKTYEAFLQYCLYCIGFKIRSNFHFS